jgi:hypothetical protein
MKDNTGEFQSQVDKRSVETVSFYKEVKRRKGVSIFR